MNKRSERLQLMENIIRHAVKHKSLRDECMRTVRCGAAEHAREVRQGRSEQEFRSAAVFTGEGDMSKVVHTTY